MREMLARMGRYSLLRLALLVLAVVVAVYLTVLIANMGGELDQVKRAQIRADIALAVYMDEANSLLPPETLRQMVDEMAETAYRAQGLDQPFFVRSFRYLEQAMTLRLGRAEQMTSDAGSRQVRLILLERLPSTLILFATADLLLFFLALLVALFLSRRYGSFLDRLTIGLAPSSAAPGWFYGIFLILIFAFAFRKLGLPALPDGGMMAAPPPPTTLGRALSTMKHLILPVSAILIGAVFASVYSWRTFFLIYSSEDYVELAKAKGLASQAIERRYILRPSMPPIITNFMLTLIVMWMGAIVLEYVFKWPGIGQLYYQAVQLGDTPVIVAVIVIFGYLLAATLFLLDFIYAILDPRVRVGIGR
ncbi:MAG: ABC transporter permease [Dehalococcoidia bacterium]